MNDTETVGRLSGAVGRLLASWRSSGLNPDMLEPIKRYVFTRAKTDPHAFLVHANLSDIDKPLWTQQRNTSLVKEHGHPIAAQSIAISGFEGRLLYRPLDETLEAHALHDTDAARVLEEPGNPIQRLTNLAESEDPALRTAIDRTLYSIRIHDALEERSKQFAAKVKHLFGKKWKEEFTKKLPTFQEAFENDLRKRVEQARISSQNHTLPASLEDILIHELRLVTPFHDAIPVDEPGAHSYLFQIDKIATPNFGEPKAYLAAIDAMNVKLAGDRPHNGATMHPDTRSFGRYYDLLNLIIAFSRIENASPQERKERFDLLAERRARNLKEASKHEMYEVAKYKRVIEFFKMGYTINSANTNLLEPLLWPLSHYEAYRAEPHNEHAVRTAGRLLVRSLWIASNSLAAQAYRNALVGYLYETDGKMAPEEFRELETWAKQHVANLTPRTPFATKRGNTGPAVYDGMWRVLAAAENKELWVMNPTDYAKQARKGHQPTRSWLPDIGWRKDDKHHIAYSLALSALGSQWSHEFTALEHEYESGGSVRDVGRLVLARQEEIRKELSRGKGA